MKKKVPEIWAFRQSFKFKFQYQNIAELPKGEFKASKASTIISIKSEIEQNFL